MSSWSDRFLSPELRADPAVLSRGRLTVVLSMVLIWAAVGYSAFYFTVAPFRPGALILGASAVLAAGAVGLLRVRPWLRGVGHALTSVLYLALVGLVAFEGGLDSIATPWLATPPIFAILLFGRRGAAGWAALCVLTIVALYVAESRGVRFPTAYPSAWAARLTLGSHAGLVICTAVLLFVFENIRAGAQARAEQASAALARLAYHDALTGLVNRARFHECLDAALARALAADDPGRVAVLLLDLDGFKGVNDTMGHAAGDTLLSQVAARLLNATRGCDTVARLGGDEFAVLLDGVRDDGDATVVGRRIVEAVGVPYALPGGQARVAASLGLARAPRGADPRALAAHVLHHADVAMYRAKAGGGDRWSWFAPEMLADAVPCAPRATAVALARLGIA